MTIREIKENKRDFLPLLLLADEKESMIDLYLDRGIMFVLEDGGAAVGECVVTDEGGGVLEIQNLAVADGYRGKGYGKRLIEYVSDRFGSEYAILQVGTGDSPLTVPFYEHLGFSVHHIVKNYIVEHYDKPIYEGGKQLIDKVYLRKKRKREGYDVKFKKGSGWCAAYDEERGRYFGENGGVQCYKLYELTKEQFDLLDLGMGETAAEDIMCEGRRMYMSVNDRCGPPYTIVFDDDYRTLCPWADVVSSGKVWSDNLTDAAVELFESEKNNRELRRKKREEHERKKNDN